MKSLKLLTAAMAFSVITANAAEGAMYVGWEAEMREMHRQSIISDVQEALEENIRARNAVAVRASIALLRENRADRLDGGRRISEETCLHDAAEIGDKDVIEALLENIDIEPGILNAQSHHGVGCETALHVAARLGHEDACRALLNADADFNITNSAGRNARDEALHHGHHALASIIDDYMNPMLVKSAAKVD